ncbi:MAG: glycosyltransferase [Mycobacterium sp.]|uniref:glycosyltransferase n=1 Tax=Mycobacterium sp. TaxID=1785 RepID=UPI001EC76A3E|nr:glycosyltransferase [Mycobacterium sp.]MBV8788347.1 glycosyltransferase [Mycobacterium sp.]
MKFVLACYGTRGDIEPSAAVGHELVRRGHEVRIAVPPEQVGFAESTGLTALPYGPEVREFHDEEFLRNMWRDFFRNPVKAVLGGWEPIIRYWNDVGTALLSLARDADLLSTALNFEQAAANVAEHYDIPLAALHHFPMRANGQLVPALPAPLLRSGMAALEWLFWRSTRKVEDAQRSQLGLPKATRRSERRNAERALLEIQAYDSMLFTGLAAEWAEFSHLRPFVGALTMEMTTKADEDVAAWIAAGPPPICFATGSIPVESPAATVEMISIACAELSERGLICFGGTDFTDLSHPSHLKVIGAANYAAIFPSCRAVVHHGGSGTTAAGLRAGIPALILWSSADQPYWGAQVKRLKVGTARRFSAANSDSLVRDLRRILAPSYAVRARKLAARMTTPTESIMKTADLFEDMVRRKASGVPGSPR